MLLLQILDLKTRLLREKGKEIENKTNKQTHKKQEYLQQLNNNNNNRKYQQTFIPKNLPYIQNDYNNSCC